MWSELKIYGNRLSKGRPERLVPAVLFLSSLLILGAAYSSEKFGGLAPCVLCLYQRAAYAAVIMLSGCALGLSFTPAQPPLWGRVLVALCGFAFLVGGGIAAFHAGVEQGWWEGAQSCVGSDFSSATSIEDLRARLAAAPLIRCDDIQWSLFGISMAGYNVFVSLGLAVISFIGLKWMMEEKSS